MGSSKKQTVGYWYRPAIQFGLSQGPIDKISRVRGGDVDAWAGALKATGTVAINAPEMWGGEDSEGGMQGDLDFMFGESGQQPNADFQTMIGGDPSAHRGIATAFWKGGRYGAMNPYPKPISFLISRIVRGWNEERPWYPEVAAVPIGMPGILDLGPTSDGWRYWVGAGDAGIASPSFDDSAWLVGASPFASATGHPYAGAGGYPNAVGTLWPVNTTIWVRRRFRLDDIAGFFLQIFVDNFATVWVNGHLVLPRVGNGTQPSVEAFLHTIEVPAHVLRAGENLIVLKAEDVGSRSYAAFKILSDGALVAMNAAHIIYDSLTDQRMQGEPLALINDESFRAAADTLYDERFGLCTTFDPDQETVEGFRQRICEVIGAQCSRSTVNGQWYLDLIRGDYEVAALPVLTDDDILEFQDDPSVIDDAVNQMAVKWFDPVTKQDRITAPVHSLGAIQAMGSIVAETKDYREIPVESLAGRVAERDLLNKSTPLWRKTLKTNRKPWSWRIGTHFRIQAAKYGVEDMVCLVGDIDKGTLRSGAISLVAVQSIFSMPSASYVVGQPAEPPPDRTPAPVLQQRVFEAPYVELAGVLPGGELAALDDQTGILQAVGARPGVGGAYQLQVKGGGGVFEAAGNFDWCPSALVQDAATIDPEPAQFTLSDGTLLERVEVGTAAMWGEEIVRVDALDSATGILTLGRGCGDTVASLHEPGERIWFYDTWASTDQVERVTAEEVEVVLLTRTGTAMLPVESAIALPLTFRHRQARPYPPAGLLVNGELSPEAISGVVDVTWAHRDRLLQIDQLVDQSMASVGPEPGTTYNVRWILNGVEVHSDCGIEGSSASFLPPGAGGLLRIEVESVRDGLVSWQMQVRELSVGSSQQVTSLLHLDGPNASTVFVDEQGNIWARQLGAAISTAQAKFGSSSLSVPSGNIWSSTALAPGIGTQDFTIEGWIRPSAQTNRGVFQTTLSSNASGIGLGHENVRGGEWQVYFAGSIHTVSATPLILSSWEHFAVERYAGVVTFYLGGVALISFSSTAEITQTSLYLGGYYSQTFAWGGHIDEFRTTIGDAVYQGEFVPPTSPF